MEARVRELERRAQEEREAQERAEPPTMNGAHGGQTHTPPQMPSSSEQTGYE